MLVFAAAVAAAEAVVLGGMYPGVPGLLEVECYELPINFKMS